VYLYFLLDLYFNKMLYYGYAKCINMFITGGKNVLYYPKFDEKTGKYGKNILRNLSERRAAVREIDACQPSFILG